MKSRPDLAQKREQIRDTILNAAVSEFAKSGLRGGSVQAIADQAGLSKAQLYYYFSGKEELYEQALLHIIHIWEDLFSIEHAEKGPAEFFRGYIRRKLRLSLEHPEISQLYSNEILQGAPYLKKYWQISKNKTENGTARIQEWIDRGLMRPIDPILLQINIWGVTQNYALHAAQVRFLTGIEDDARFDADHLIDEAIDLFLHGCGIKQDDRSG